MTKVQYKSYNQNDRELLPPSLGDFIAANHPVRVVNRIIDSWDISEIENTYKGGGAPGYHPRMMLKILVYSYLNNIYSGREMEKMLKDSIPFLWLSGKQFPDFRTINIFRSERLGEGRFESLFMQVVFLLQQEGLVSLDVQYIDGTKIESCANKYTFVWKRSVEKHKARLEAKIAVVLDAANKVLNKEIAQDTEQGITADQLEEKVDNILHQMAQQGLSDKKLRRSVEEVKKDMLPRIKGYEKKLDTLGDRNSYSKTDPGATFMRMKEDAMNNGQTKPGYNVQIATENQIITNYGIYCRPNDQSTLIPFLESFKKKYGIQSKTVSSDAGYGSEPNYEYMEEHDIEAYVKYNMFHAEKKSKRKNNPFLVQNMSYNKDQNFYVCPKGQRLSFVKNITDTSDLGYVSTLSIYRAQNCSGCPMRGMCYQAQEDVRVIKVNHKNDAYRAKARERLDSEQGLYHRKKRAVEPEAVFGQIKYDHCFKRFRLKSTAKVSTEFGLVALAHNLRKYIARQARSAANELAVVAPIAAVGSKIAAQGCFSLFFALLGRENKTETELAKWAI